MRTTINIDDQVLAAARAISKDRGISIGTALSELARRGLEGKPTDTTVAFPRFTRAPSSIITLDKVNEHRDD